MYIFVYVFVPNPFQVWVLAFFDTVRPLLLVFLLGSLLKQTTNKQTNEQTNKLTNGQQTSTNNNKQQTTNNKQQTTNNKQQTTNNKQQTTSNKQQTTNNKQQTTNNHTSNNHTQHTTNNQQQQQPTTTTTTITSFQRRTGIPVKGFNPHKGEIWLANPIELSLSATRSRPRSLRPLTSWKSTLIFQHGRLYLC